MLKKAILVLLVLHVGIVAHVHPLCAGSCSGKKTVASNDAPLFCHFTILQPSGRGWDLFAKVKFTPQLVKEVNEYFLMPSFDSKIRLYEGKEITLQGYYIPVDVEGGRTIILSKVPYSQCFFCGGAGPESISEITFALKPPKLKADQVIKVTGILRLNDKDIDHLNFILDNARIENGK